MSAKKNSDKRNRNAVGAKAPKATAKTGTADIRMC